MRRRPGTLEPSKEILEALIHLARLTPMRNPPHLDLEAVEAVEADLECDFSDDVLALFACGGDELADTCGIELAEVRTMTDDAHELGCPDELVAIGRDTDGHVYFCVRRKSSETAGRIYVFDAEDGGASPMSLLRWMVERISVAAQSATEHAAPFVAPALTGTIASPPLEVRHEKFGSGTVLREIGQGADKKLEIRFGDATRVLMASAVMTVPRG